MLILGLLGMYFDAVVVFVTSQTFLLRLALAILWEGSCPERSWPERSCTRGPPRRSCMETPAHRVHFKLTYPNACCSWPVKWRVLILESLTFNASNREAIKLGPILLLSKFSDLRPWFCSRAQLSVAIEKSLKVGSSINFQIFQGYLEINISRNF